jgi:hypothetical protein
MHATLARVFFLTSPAHQCGRLISSPVPRSRNQSTESEERNSSDTHISVDAVYYRSTTNRQIVVRADQRLLFPGRPGRCSFGRVTCNLPSPHTAGSISSTFSHQRRSLSSHRARPFSPSGRYKSTAPCFAAFTKGYPGLIVIKAGSMVVGGNEPRRWYRRPHG